MKIFEIAGEDKTMLILKDIEPEMFSIIDDVNVAMASVLKSNDPLYLVKYLPMIDSDIAEIREFVEYNFEDHETTW